MFASEPTASAADNDKALTNSSVSGDTVREAYLVAIVIGVVRLVSSMLLSKLLRK